MEKNRLPASYSVHTPPQKLSGSSSSVTFAFNVSETGELRGSGKAHMKQGKTRDLSASCGTSLQNSPFLPGDD